LRFVVGNKGGRNLASHVGLDPLEEAAAEHGPDFRIAVGPKARDYFLTPLTRTIHTG
jgi:hypothetical protein